jgi:hypothetical protein
MRRLETALDVLAEMGQYVVSDLLVEVLHEPIERDVGHPRRPILCESPWLCERYLDAEMWIEGLISLVDRKPPVRFALGRGDSMSDARSLLARSVMSYVIGREERGREQDRAMFLYVPERLKRGQTLPTNASEPRSPVTSVIWLHSLDEFLGWTRDVGQFPLADLKEAIRRVPSGADRERRDAGWSIAPHHPHQVVKRGAKVLDEIPEKHGDFIRQWLSSVGGDDEVRTSFPRFDVFSDLVRPAIPIALQTPEKIFSVLVRPLDLECYGAAWERVRGPHA